MKCFRAIALAGLGLGLSITILPAQTVTEKVDFAVAQKLRDEEMNRGKLDDLATYLTDVIGARLTNSPASRKANA